MDQFPSASVLIFLLIFVAIVMVVSMIGLIGYVWSKALEKIGRNHEKSQVIHQADIEILKEEQNVRMLHAKRNLNCLQLTDGQVIEAEPVIDETKTHIWR